VKGWRRLPPVKATRKFGREVASSLSARIAEVFTKIAKTVRKEISAALIDVTKADETDEERQLRIEALAELISDQVDLSGLDVLADITAEELERLVKDTAGRVLAQLGVADRADLVDQVNEIAVEMANERAAELVGMRYVDGEFVENPNAEYRIADATRNLIRQAIAEGLDENIGLNDIIDNIEALGFSEDRADLIARTEIARANSDAAVASYGAARDAGVAVRKAWILGENPCAICEENEAEGDIDIDDDFPSGDDAPPAHPNCECAVVPVVEDDGETEEE
jgi:uncharacterized protein with gpF-like domain